MKQFSHFNMDYNNDHLDNVLVLELSPAEKQQGHVENNNSNSNSNNIINFSKNNDEVKSNLKFLDISNKNMVDNHSNNNSNNLKEDEITKVNILSARNNETDEFGKTINFNRINSITKENPEFINEDDS